MAVTRRRARPRFTLLVLLLASATIITLSYRGQLDGVINGARHGAGNALSPIQSAVSAALRPVGSFFEGAANYGSLQAQNAKLAQENARLRAQGLQVPAAERQLHSLQALQRLPYAEGIPSVTAEVVAQSSSNFAETVDIGKGSSSGVGAGMPVVSAGGLVGSVVSTSDHRATILLLTDPKSEVGVNFGQPPTRGVASGQGANQPLQVSFVNPSFKVRKGEVVPTSGLQSSKFPPNVPVGRVRSAHLAPSALQWDITLAPLADLSNLQYVRVLEWAPKP